MNILLVMADQWGAAQLGCYGCPLPVSPHLDEFARQGRRFNRFYADIPLCAPSRATIFSGLSPSQHGVLSNEHHLKNDVTFFPQILRERGFDTWGVGKFHFTPMDEPPPRELERFGFNRALVSEDSRHGAWLEWVAQNHPQHYEAALSTSWPFPYIGDLRPRWQAAYDKFVVPRQRESGKRIFYESPVPEEASQTNWIAQTAIEELRNARDDEPFFGFVSFVAPHDPFAPPREWLEKFPEANSPLPQEWTEANSPSVYRKFQNEMFQIGEFDAHDWTNLRRHFFASCAHVDDAIGRVLRALDEANLSEQTLVVFLTDHGEMAGDHGLLMKGPWHYDSAVRMPLLVRGPGVESGVENGLTQTRDLAPTLLNWAQSGEFLLPQRDAVKLSSHSSYVGPVEVETLISDDNWRLSRFAGEDYGELFDLNTDPSEQINLFDSEPERRAAMERRLNALNS